MITAKQAEARRRNGRLSRGPKTPEGKARSSRNALKYGLTSRDPLHPGESAEEFAAFRKKMLVSLGPRSESESRLATELINNAWLLKRCALVDASIWNNALNTEAAELKRERRGRHPKAKASENLALIGRAFQRGAQEFASLYRQEVRISRAFHRAFSLWHPDPPPRRRGRPKNMVIFPIEPTKRAEMEVNQ